MWSSLVLRLVASLNSVRVITEPPVLPLDPHSACVVLCTDGPPFSNPIPATFLAPRVFHVPLREWTGTIVVDGPNGVVQFTDGGGSWDFGVSSTTRQLLTATGSGVTVQGRLHLNASDLLLPPFGSRATLTLNVTVTPGQTLNLTSSAGSPIPNRYGGQWVGRVLLPTTTTVLAVPTPNPRVIGYDGQLRYQLDVGGNGLVMMEGGIDVYSGAKFDMTNTVCTEFIYSSLPPLSSSTLSTHSCSLACLRCRHGSVHESAAH